MCISHTMVTNRSTEYKTFNWVGSLKQKPLSVSTRLIIMATSIEDRVLVAVDNNIQEGWVTLKQTKIIETCIPQIFGMFYCLVLFWSNLNSCQQQYDLDMADNQRLVVHETCYSIIFLQSFHYLVTLWWNICFE